MIEHAVWLMLWGVIVGLDLVSVAQTMIARPIVAGTIAGLIAGDPVAGATVGTVLELFALDVLPVGASRYPDYGIGAVAGTATASGAPWVLGTGLGVLVGLLVAYAASVGVHAVRVRNAADTQRFATVLSEGDYGTIAAMHWRAVIRDTLRALLVSVVGVLLGIAVHRWFPLSTSAALYLVIVALGAAVAGAVNGMIRVTAAQRWLAAGIVVGVLGVLLL